MEQIMTQFMAVAQAGYSEQLLALGLIVLISAFGAFFGLMWGLQVWRKRPITWSKMLSIYLFIIAVQFITNGISGFLLVLTP